jgi:beta-lactamase class C
LKKRFLNAAIATLVLGFSTVCHAYEIAREDVMQAVSATVLPAMEKNQIPGMAVALVLNERTYIFNYGVADLVEQYPVTDATIFEIGSISKAFTATLATHAEVMDKLKLTNKVATYLPALAGTDFGNLSLVHLGTHTVGGMPLQVPDDVHNKTQLLDYLRTWTAEYKAGTMRTYSNLSIGVLGWITARSLNQDFSAAMKEMLFGPMNLNNTYLTVPANQLTNYAWGYTKDMKAVRVNPGVLDSEAYGIKTTASDLSLFLKANMAMLPLHETLKTALGNTHKGYFTVGKMTQNLIWEAYSLPVDLPTLQAGNASSRILNPIAVSVKEPPSDENRQVWVNKTGSTNGFGAYVAFVPEKRFGIVLLANKNYPNAERVAIAHAIYSKINQ